MNRLFSIVIFLFLLSAVCWAGGNKETGAKPTSLVQKQTVSQYWIGDGGKGKSIAILAPKATGLAANQSYLPALVQGEFVSNFLSYSAISVLDRQRLDDQYAELLSGYYADNAQASLDLGHLTPTDYIMGGNITRTATGYVLQIQITKTTDKMTVSSYSGTFTFAELDNLMGIRRASLELLEKMGVTPTERMRTELAGAAEANHVNAQTALAQGIIAQQKGTVVEALTYYYEAATFDSGLAEVTSRSSILSAYIQSGNLGENVRNDIQQRNAWLKVLQEADKFYKAHPPYEILYNPALTQGKIDYSKETVDISFEVGLFSTEAGFRVLTDLKQGLEKTGRSKDWGFDNWPDSGDAAVLTGNILNYRIKAVLMDKNEIVIGNTEGEFKIENGLRFINDSKQLTFRGVDVNKISDNLLVSIVSVNGIDAKTMGERGYINISTGDAIILPVGFSIKINNGIISIAGDALNLRGEIIIPSKIGRRLITSIGDRAFQYGRFTSVTIPDSITSIGEWAFGFNNSLTNVIIGNNVTSIGTMSFSFGVTKITIPANVDLKDGHAFSNGFDDFYKNNGKRAGNYIYNGKNWKRE